jgi:hypothetical protein
VIRRALVCASAAVLLIGSPAQGYSVLAHEAIVDLAWDHSIKPILLRRFPRTTPDGLLEARSYAYGGSVIQDLGYYPFGNKFFSNLVHYTRSGDFVEALIHDARDGNELAFGLGALAHYVADNTGHPEAVNRSVPLLFPKLRAKYGQEVTYVEGPRQHIMVEFSFDVVQAAGGGYLPDAYRSFIGFRVTKPLLERAFRETYGLEMKDVFLTEDRAIGTYRYAVSQIMPALTQAAWRDKREDIEALTPNVQQRGFVFKYGRAEFEHQYGRDYQKPHLFARFLATVYRVLPKIGPLKRLTFKAPTPEAQNLFLESFRHANERYQAELARVSSGDLNFRNTDFDTGRPAKHGEYALADNTYAELLKRLEARKFEGVPIALRRDVLAFYGSQPGPSNASKDDREHWDRVQTALIALRNEQ